MALTGGAAAPAAAGYGGAGAAGAAGAGEAAAGGLLSGGAFGSADMLAQAVPGAGLLGGVESASTLPALASGEAPIPYGPNMAEMADGSYGLTLEASGMTPNSFTGGYDSLNGMQRMGQRLTGAMDQMDPSKMLRMFGQQPQQQQPMGRSPAIQRPQSQPSTEAQSPYSQTISGGVQLTDEQKMRLLQQLYRG